MPTSVKLFTLIIGVIIISSCSSEDDIVPDDVVLSYGYSFGQCLGYCSTETYLSDRQVTVVKRANVKGREPVKSNAPLPYAKLDEILNAIDYEKFRKLPGRIGCPDCNDGGAEWLELIFDDDRKKVTFEYRQDVDGIAGAVELLRELTEEVEPFIDYD